jgi:hypothetical protein
MKLQFGQQAKRPTHLFRKMNSSSKHERKQEKKGFPWLETWSLWTDSCEEPIIDPVQKKGDCKNEPNQEAMEMADNEP